MKKIYVGLASCFYISYLPAALAKWLSPSLSRRKRTGAGLMGSLFGALAYLMLPPEYLESLWLLLIGIAVSVYISGRAEKILKVHDDSRIVIDEVIGVWIAMWGLGQTLGPQLIVAFILFRWFDCMKGPWGRALQKLPGGWGITLDDVAAGVLANGATRFLFCILN